jgi:hypothetical protein
MVAPNKNVVTIHRTTFTADRNSTSAARPQWVFELIQRFTTEMSRHLARQAKVQANTGRKVTNVARRLADYRSARPFGQRR